jgi:hypothetical protein
VAVVHLLAVVLEVDGADVELHVGCREARAGADEGDGLGDGRGQRTGAPQEPLGQVLRCVGLVERVGVGHLPHHREERVVLEVASDAAQLVDDRHADLPEVLGRADARQHQDLR